MIYRIKAIFIAVLLLSAGVLPAKETLQVKFDRKQDIAIGDAKVAVDGVFTPDHFMEYGENGVSFPAATLLGQQGTIFFRFKLKPFKDKLLIPRYLFTLRAKSRLSIGMYFVPARPRLNFFFSDQKNKYYFSSPENLVPDRTYTAAITWDGKMARYYLDGIMLSENAQPVAVENISMLNIGPYRDGWVAPKPWANDTLAGELRTWNEALTPAQIRDICGVKKKNIAEMFPTRLAVPELTVAAPVIDGEMKDKAWQYAAGMVALTDGRAPYKSWTLPPNSFRMIWDKKNLYLGFTTLFPGRVQLKPGNTRTDKEPSAWGYESFEFYLYVNDQLYRFAGNLAGGYTEWRGSDKNWNGEWQYRSSLKMRIDDRQLWQGEIAIPWTTLGLNAPPAKPVKFNFCRSWQLPETATYSSLLPEGQYNLVKQYPEMTFTAGTPAMRVEQQNNPEYGKFEQTIALMSPVSTKVNYEVQLASEDGSMMPLILANNNISLAANELKTEKLMLPIQKISYNRLVFTFKQQDKLLMQQIMPFKLNQAYLAVKPRFSKEQLLVTLKQTMLRDKFGPNASFMLELKAPDGKVVYKQALAGQPEVTVPFLRTSQAGSYSMELLNASDRALVFKQDFYYPGLGEWETFKFDNRIIPPFLPLDVKQAGGRLDVSMWGRRYQWQNNLFPELISSRQQELLAAPVVLEANGRELIGGTVEVGKVAKHRAEFVSALDSPECLVNDKAWIEYDGVQWNEVSLKAKRNLKNVKLKIKLPAELVHYLHAADSSTWGAKLTEPVKPGTRTLRFYPVVWLGMEDKGLCFFAESRSGWKSLKSATYQLKNDGKTVVLEVNLADQLKAGEDFKFDFGLLASPVKPLPKNYPLNTFNWHYTAPLNRENQPPAAEIMLIGGRDLGGFFGDLPTLENSSNGKMLNEQIETIHKFQGKAIPYTIARYLPDEYPEVIAFRDEWKISPEQTLNYDRNGSKRFIYDCCPVSGASAFFMQKFREMLKNYKIDGIYFDFGLVPFCNNPEHGCHDRIPLLAMREFYRRIALTQLDAGIKDPVIVLHNTDSVQLPAMTFATHLFNGEHIRQHSSTIMHNGKDILDTYDVSMFANELSSLPFGLTNSVYQSNDVLIPQFGGGKEDPSLYKFRITQAMLTGALVHNTLPAMTRCHYGIFDKIIRIYRKFNVAKAKFYGYWENPAKVIRGKDVFVSVYKSPTEPKILAVISHIGKEHITQDVEIEFNTKLLGLSSFKDPVDLLNAPDPEYADLAARVEKYKVPAVRAFLKLGDFGVKVEGVENNVLKLKLKYHCFAIIELTGRKN